jgi:hypothetical protein
MDLNKFAHQQQHDSADEAIGWAKVGVAQSGESLRAGYEKQMLGFKAREDARAVAGVQRNDAEAVQKKKEVVMKPDPNGNDEKYVTNLVKADPALSKLSSDQQKAAGVEIQLTARRRLADRINKPTDDMPSADDFLNEMQKAAASVAKRVQPKKAFGVSYGGQLAPRTPTEGPPAAPAYAPVQPPLPIPKGIPAGSKSIGTTPDGKPVWQDPSGKKWVE